MDWLDGIMFSSDASKYVEQYVYPAPSVPTPISDYILGMKVLIELTNVPQKLNVGEVYESKEVQYQYKDNWLSIREGLYFKRDDLKLFF